MKYGNEEIRRRKNRKDKIKNVLYIIVHIILLPIIIYNIFLIIQSLVKPNETPSFLGIKTYVIISGSMQPEIEIGDIVVVKEIKNADNQIKIGDVIAFRKGESVITHRISNIEQDENGILRITTKGDNNNTDDRDYILINNIEGKAVAVIPRIGYFILALQNKVIIIVIFILYYIYISHSDNIKRKKRERRMKRLEYEEKHNMP